MSAVLHEFSDSLPAGTRIVEEGAGLGEIHRPDCAAVIWQRGVQAAFQNWIETLDPDHLPKARVILRPDEIPAALTAICDGAKTPKGRKRTLLIEDIVSLADTFAEITEATYLRLRLDVVTTNACRRFHIDAVTSRLVCTYRGTGTQYGTTRQGEDPSRVFTTPAFSPIVLRGTKWPEQPCANLRHRSPPIAGTGETRLLLVLDPVSDPDQDL